MWNEQTCLYAQLRMLVVLENRITVVSDNTNTSFINSQNMVAVYIVKCTVKASVHHCISNSTTSLCLMQLLRIPKRQNLCIYHKSHYHSLPGRRYCKNVHTNYQAACCWWAPGNLLSSSLLYLKSNKVWWQQIVNSYCNTSVHCNIFQLYNFVFILNLKTTALVVV